MLNTSIKGMCNDSGILYVCCANCIYNGKKNMCDDMCLDYEYNEDVNKYIEINGIRYEKYYIGFKYTKFEPIKINFIEESDFIV